MANRTLEKFAANRGINRTNGVAKYLESQGLYDPASGLDPFTVITSVPGFSDRTDQRGNPKYNDSYMLTTVKLIYHIPGKIRCPVIR